MGSFRLDASVEGTGTICVAGRNGAGKSTLMKAIAGFLALEEGYVRVGGVDVTRLPVEKKGVVMVTPESAFLHMDVDSHLRWGAKLKGRTFTEAEVARVKSDLGIDYSGKVGSLSLGMRERVSLASALLASPRAILVDDVFSSLHGKEECIARYRELTGESGIDLLFTSQDPSDGKLAGRLYLMNSGSASLVT